jgi:peptide/nickel transport system substrate-binding protein
MQSGGLKAAVFPKEDRMLQTPGRRVPIVSFFSFIAVVLLFTGCAPQGTPTTNKPGGPVQKGGTWVVDLFNEPDSLIPNASSQTFAYLVDQSLYAPLFVGDTEGHIQPGIATELPTTENGGISSDLKTWTFKLRPGLKWSDGQPLTAEDVDFTWRLWMNPKFAAADTVAFRLIESTQISSDKLSITFKLKEPYAPFIASWTDGYHAPMPKHHFESMDPSEIKKAEGLNPKVVSGPFKMKESKPGVQYVVVRNENYYRASEGYPYLDSVVFRAVPNQDTILKDLQAGTADSAWFLDVTKLDAYKALQDYEVVQYQSSYYEAIHFNFNNPALKDVNVRKAINMAIDRDELVKTARLGQGKPLCVDHGPAYDPGYQPDIQCPKFDIDGANKLLDQAGWVKGSDGVRQKNGLRLEFQYSTTAKNRWRERDQLINQDNFKKIGIKVNISNYPANTFFGSLLPEGKPGKYDLAEWGSSYSNDPNNSSMYACSQIPPKGQNYNFYCDPEFDKLLAQQVATADKEKRQQIFNQLHQKMIDDAVIASMFALVDLAVHKKGTNNYKPSPFGPSETINVWEWWCDGGKCPHS